MSFNNIQGNFEAELINRSLSPCWAGPTASRFFLDQYAKLCIDHHEDNFGAPANPTWSKIPTNGGQHLHCISSHLISALYNDKHSHFCICSINKGEHANICYAQHAQHFCFQNLTPFIQMGIINNTSIQADLQAQTDGCSLQLCCTVVG
jgi:hypothetical protein